MDPYRTQPAKLPPPERTLREKVIHYTWRLLRLGACVIVEQRIVWKE
jgi:hypothetical protein